jgi:hypothetical protein
MQEEIKTDGCFVVNPNTGTWEYNAYSVSNNEREEMSDLSSDDTSGDYYSDNDLDPEQVERIFKDVLFTWSEIGEVLMDKCGARQYRRFSAELIKRKVPQKYKLVRESLYKSFK